MNDKILEFSVSLSTLRLSARQKRFAIRDTVVGTVPATKMI